MLHGTRATQLWQQVKTRIGSTARNACSESIRMFSRNLPALFESNVRITSARLGNANLNGGPGSGIRPQDCVRRETGDLSTLVSQPAPQPSWKQEVNRRLAAHKSRKGLSVVEEDASSEAQGAPVTRAAQAAARVAARYAKAPSYSEMQAAEARAALRAAETATRAALEAQAAAQAVLASLETAAAAEANDLPAYKDAPAAVAPVLIQTSSVEQAWEIEVPPAPVVTSQATGQAMEIRWDPDLPVRPAETPAAPALRDAEESEVVEDNWWGSATLADASAALHAIEPVEAAQPIHANLIEFPRELVATRRMRPRITGAQQGQSAEPNGQLSIFEVDPSTISIEPEVTEAATEAPAPSWSSPEWSGIELDEQIAGEAEIETATVAAAPEVQLAPFGRRLMSAVVDGALILGVACGAIAALINHMQHLPIVKTAELGAIVILIATGVLYKAFFLTVAKSTPGMMYARIGLRTFGGESPTRARRWGRLGAMLLSLLPVGLGVVWGIFDEDHLSWHDRLSGTYLQRC